MSNMDTSAEHKVTIIPPILHASTFIRKLSFGHQLHAASGNVAVL